MTKTYVVGETTLLSMPDTTDTAPYARADLDDPTGRLARYLAKTQTPLDLLALLTLWIVVVPPGDFGSAQTAAIIARTALSGVYAIDISIQAWFARRHWRYIRSHPVSLLAVALPPLRVLLSLRLVRTVFRRGHLDRFLLVAGVLVLNGAIAVYLYERHAAGSNIRTLGDAVWWSLVTVTTVGYGDLYPVTTLGRVAAVVIMAIGITTLAVVTAQVASSFLGPPAQRGASVAGPPTSGITLADLDNRLARIEQLLAAGAPGGPARGQ
jgi:voltage-gated potassium channel